MILIINIFFFTVFHMMSLGNCDLIIKITMQLQFGSSTENSLPDHMLPDVLELLQSCRFQKVITSPTVNPLHDGLGVAVRRQHCYHSPELETKIIDTDELIKMYIHVLTNHRNVHFDTNDLQKLDPIHVRHVHVAYNEIELVFLLPQNR